MNVDLHHVPYFAALLSGGFSFADFQIGAQNCLPCKSFDRSTTCLAYAGKLDLTTEPPL